MHSFSRRGTLSTALALAALALASAGSGTRATASPGPVVPVNPLPPAPGTLPVGPPAPPPAPPLPPPDPIDTSVPPTIYGHNLNPAPTTTVFVVDISGAMAYDVQAYVNFAGVSTTGTRLDRAVAAIQSSVNALPASMTFNVVSYDCDVYTWMADAIPADAANKAAAIAYLATLQSNGGGAGTGPAVATVLWDPTVTNVVLATGAEPDCGAGSGMGGAADIQAHRQMIAAANTHGAVIDVLGVSAASDPLLEQFCTEVAQDSGGTETDAP